MQKRMIRWIIGGIVALTLAYGLVLGGSQPPVAHGESPTPTPTQLTGTNSDPGGSGGGGH